MDHLVSKFGGQRILVVGDVMLDEHVWGSSSRLSPEAPVPVVEEQRRTHVPGGAANAACLGARVLAGVIGGDESEHQKTGGGRPPGLPDPLADREVCLHIFSQPLTPP